MRLTTKGRFAVTAMIDVALYGTGGMRWVSGNYYEQTDWSRHPAVYLAASAPTILIYLLLNTHFIKI